MKKTHKLGWLPDVPDVRDVAFAAVFKAPKRLPSAADLRAGCSPVENQGELGSCTAQALVGALEFLELAALRPPSACQLKVMIRPSSPVPRPFPTPKTKHLTPPSAPPPPRYRDLSRLFVYYNERAAMDTVNEDSGAMLRTGIKTLARLGVCREELWPYDIASFARKPGTKCYAEAVTHKINAYQRLASLDDVRACLAMGLPFVFGFSVYENAMTAAVARTGAVRMPRPGERMLGGHAVLGVGYDDRRQCLLFRNSWGAQWGQAGYGALPYGYLEDRNLSDDFWCIQSAASSVYAMNLSRR